MNNSNPSWDRFKQYHLSIDPLKLSLDISKVSFSDEEFESLTAKTSQALKSMQLLENGEVAKNTGVVIIF